MIKIQLRNCCIIHIGIHTYIHKKVHHLTIFHLAYKLIFYDLVALANSHYHTGILLYFHVQLYYLVECNGHCQYQVVPGNLQTCRLVPFLTILLLVHKLVPRTKEVLVTSNDKRKRSRQTIVHIMLLFISSYQVLLHIFLIIWQID